MLSFLLLTLLSGSVLASLARQDRFEKRGYSPLTDLPVDHAGTEFGVNVSLEQYTPAELQDNLSRISSLGIGKIKQSFYFTPAFDWAEADQMIEAVAQTDLELVVLLDGHPDNDFAPPDDVMAYASWAGEFARRYGSRIRAYLIWDEPNIASHWGNQPINPDLYGALLAAAAREIRAVDPDAIIGAAPLAPTAETTKVNMAEPLFLQALYENGAAASFDFAAGKPYGFDSAPTNRDVGIEHLNFSRIILLREVMVAHGDGHKALWAGNWGWNALPGSWTGSPSIWGAVSEQEQVNYLANGLARSKTEWPWMGPLFWHHWDPDAPADDPVQGFSLQKEFLLEQIPSLTAASPAAQPGFHFASADHPAFAWQGDWEFSPEFGADMSQKEAGEPPDTVTFAFEGTDVGLRVRRANYRARFYVLVDGRPANALPPDETTASAGWGSALVLNTNDPDSDYLAVEPVATGLNPGPHTLTITAYRGWDQFALNGISVRQFPTTAYDRFGLWLWVITALSAVGTVVTGRSNLRFWHRLGTLGQPAHAVLTTAVAILVTIAGWLTWNGQAAGVFRRLSDIPQLALVFGTATFFYVTPWLFVYGAGLLLLFLLLRFRPAWGLALVAFCFPFYVTQLLKPVAVYRFSPVEIFTWLLFGAAVLNSLTRWVAQQQTSLFQIRLSTADWAAIFFTAAATLSLFFTDRLDVATNEWRTIILEPLLFYASWRLIKPSDRESMTAIDGFLAGGTLVAVIGLGQYVSGTNLITAEEGIFRLRSIYGSPNNVALYLGRQIPLLFALLLLGQSAVWRRWFPAFWTHRRGRWIFGAFMIQLTAFLLTLSKGGLLLSLPVALFTVFALWQRHHQRRVWPWAAAGLLVGLIGYALVLQIPGLSQRLDIRSATGILRLNLWRSSITMWADHLWFGVGLDNFLYEYRSRYILAAAWQEPNLNHPHNLFLDLATRLGLFGLLTGCWLYFQPLKQLITTWRTTDNLAARAVAAGFLGGLAAMFAHGLVDHSFFLIDLAFSFYLTLAVSSWLSNSSDPLQL